MTLGIILLDQLTKLLIVIFMPVYKSIRVLGDFIVLRHVRNTAIAFGLGKAFPQEVKQILFLILPLAVIVFLIVFILRAKDLKSLQRWTLCAIVGGGIGNIIDRLIRPMGVVDFIDVKFFGIFGLERWPTFNVADSTIVVGICVLIISMIMTELNSRKKGVPDEQKT
ncbi:MAG: signal peptidase II [Spirochaetales bacterium]|nr:signal peptidase II [Spirochaetales bacterium]